MKVFVVLTLFAATAYPSANIFHSNCTNQAAENFIKNHVPLSNCSSDKGVCGDNCFGRVCTYYTKNNYSALCAMGYAEICFYISITPAASCQRCYDKNVMAVIDNLPASWTEQLQWSRFLYWRLCWSNMHFLPRERLWKRLQSCNSRIVYKYRGDCSHLMQKWESTHD